MQRSSTRLFVASYYDRDRRREAQETCLIITYKRCSRHPAPYRRKLLASFLVAVPPSHVIAVRIQVRFRPVEPVVEVHVYVLRLGVHPRVGGRDRGRKLAEGVMHVLGYLAEAFYEFGRVPLYVRLHGSIVAERTGALRIVGAATAELHVDEFVDRFSHVGVVRRTQPLEVVVYADGVWLGPRRAWRKAESEAGYAVFGERAHQAGRIYAREHPAAQAHGLHRQHEVLANQRYLHGPGGEGVVLEVDYRERLVAVPEVVGAEVRRYCRYFHPAVGQPDAVLPRFGY